MRPSSIDTLILFGAGMSNSNAHAPNDLPLALVGGGAGQLQGGRHLRFPLDTPVANLHLAILDKLGVPIDHLATARASWSCCQTCKCGSLAAAGGPEGPHYLASGSGRIWNFTTLLRPAPSMCDGVCELYADHTPRPFQPRRGSSIRGESERP